MASRSRDDAAAEGGEDAAADQCAEDEAVVRDDAEQSMAGGVATTAEDPIVVMKRMKRDLMLDVHLILDQADSLGKIAERKLRQAEYIESQIALMCMIREVGG